MHSERTGKILSKLGRGTGLRRRGWDRGDLDFGFDRLV